MLCLACMTGVSGCATQGLRDVEKASDNPSCAMAAMGEAGSDKTNRVAAARKCLLIQEKSYTKTARDYIDETSGWNYSFVLLAGGGVGAGIFDSGIAALKAIGLAAGTATAAEGIRSPAAMSTLYNNSASAIACIYEHSSGIASDPVVKDITDARGQLAADVIGAQAYVATGPTDKSLAMLNSMITSATSTQLVIDNAMKIANAPGDFLLGQADAVKLRIEAKLNATPATYSDLQKTIQDTVTSTTALKAAQAGAGPTSPSLPGAKAAPPPTPTTAKGWTLQIQTDISNALLLTQGLADAQANVPLCVANIPS